MFNPIIISVIYLLLIFNLQTSSLFQNNSKSQVDLKIDQHTNSSNNYREIFGNDYIDALDYFKKNKSIQMQVINKHNADADIIIPVLFPERIRYSIVRDYFETKFLETIYIDYGSDYVDFSIGDFQMKPSFIEKIEFRINKTESLKKKYSFLLTDKNDTSEIRKERVKRLKSPLYQLNYICAFYDIINTDFDLSSMPIITKIKFSASAYNFGFDKSIHEIEKHINHKYFPYGTKYPGIQYAYTDVSVDFYLNYYPKIY